MTNRISFEELVAEGSSVPIEGWDFTWFDGRASEERPAWGYSRMMAERMAQATAALEQAKSREPNKASIREALGIAYFRTRRWAEATQHRDCQTKPRTTRRVSD